MRSILLISLIALSISSVQAAYRSNYYCYYYNCWDYAYDNGYWGPTNYFNGNYMILGADSPEGPVVVLDDYDQPEEVWLTRGKKQGNKKWEIGFTNVPPKGFKRSQKKK